MIYGIANHKQLNNVEALENVRYHKAILMQWLNHHDALVYHDATVESCLVHVAKFAFHCCVEVWSAAKEHCDQFEMDYSVCQGVADN